MHNQRSKVELAGRTSRSHVEAPPPGQPVLRRLHRRSGQPGHLDDASPLRIWVERGALFSQEGPLAVRLPRFLADLGPRPLGPLTRAQLVGHPHWLTQLSLSCPLILARPRGNGPFVLVSGWETWAVLMELATASIPRVDLHAWLIRCSVTSATERAAWMTGLMIGQRSALSRGVLARAISPYLVSSSSQRARGQVSLAADLVGATRQALPKSVSGARAPRQSRSDAGVRPGHSQQSKGPHPTGPRHGRR